MTKLSTADGRAQADEQTATFRASRELLEDFRAIARRNQRTLSGELRKMVEDAVERERSAA